MSSLMQFNGNINRKGVGLLLYLVNIGEDGEDGWDAVENIQCN